MKIINNQKPVKLIVSVIFKDKDQLNIAEEFLQNEFGDFEERVKILPFDMTDYYYEEFGRPLTRKLVCFKELFDKEKLYQTKIKTNIIEEKLMLNGKRRVNIDPGYVNDAKLVLFTTKDYTHRLYLGEGIFAEVALHFYNNKFNSWPWTYPDYSSEELTDYFSKVRELYMNGIKKRV